MPEIHYPFMFEFREVVSGNGFLSSVKIAGGRALMLQEDGEWWMYGVYPAGIAETGATPNECFLRFMERIKATLVDIAVEARTFEEFFGITHKFLTETSPEEASRWNEAQQKLRTGKVEPEGELSKVPKEPPRPSSHEIDRVDCKTPAQAQTAFRPQDNVVHCKPTMAA